MESPPKKMLGSMSPSAASSGDPATIPLRADNAVTVKPGVAKPPALFALKLDLRQRRARNPANRDKDPCVRIESVLEVPLIELNIHGRRDSE